MDLRPSNVNGPAAPQVTHARPAARATRGGQHDAPRTDGGATGDASLGDSLLAAAKEVYALAADASRAARPRGNWVWAGKVAVGRWFRALPVEGRSAIALGLNGLGYEYAISGDRTAGRNLEEWAADAVRVEREAAAAEDARRAWETKVEELNVVSSDEVAGQGTPLDGGQDSSAGTAVPDGSPGTAPAAIDPAEPAADRLARAGVAPVSGGAPASPDVPTTPGYWWYLAPNGEECLAHVFVAPCEAIPRGAVTYPERPNTLHDVDDPMVAKWLGPVDRHRPVPYDEVVQALRDAHYTGEPAFEADNYRKSAKVLKKIEDHRRAEHAAAKPAGAPQ